MNNMLVKKIIVNKKIVFFVAMMIFVIGGLSYATSIKREAPSYEVPIALIQYRYIGASAQTVNDTVILPLEEELKSLDQMKSVSTMSYDNIGLVFILFEHNIDRDATFSEVREILNDSEARLPESAELGNLTMGVVPVADFIYVLSSDSQDSTEGLIELEEKANWIKEELSGLEYITSIDIRGQVQQQMELTINQPTTFPMTRLEFMDFINSLHSSVPAGTIEEEGTIYAVQSESAIGSIDDINEIVFGINPLSGAPLMLGDLIGTSVSYSDTVITKYDDKRSIIIYGSFIKNIDQTSFADDFLNEIQTIESSLSDENNAMTLKKILFYPEDVRASNAAFFRNLLIGVLLVLLVSLITMGYRNAIIVSAALPTSIFMTFIAMRALGIELHQVSISSLIIAIGMLVDNAIVVTESIRSKLDAGEQKMEACVKGTSEVAIPVLTSTLTTIAAFSPLLFLESIAGDYIRALPQVIIISLSASYLVAVTLMPCLAYLIFTEKKTKGHQAVMLEYMEKAVKFLLKRRILVMILVFGLVGLSVLTVPRLGLAFFPADDGNIIYINITNTEDVDIDSTVSKMEAIEEYIEGHHNIVQTITAIGGPVPRFWDKMMTFQDTPDFSQMLCTVDLKSDYPKNADLVGALQDELNGIDDSLRIEVKELENGQPSEAPIAIKVSSDDIDELPEAIDYTKSVLRGIEGVKFVRDDQSSVQEKYAIDYDINALLANNLLLPLVQAEVTFNVSGAKVLDLPKEGMPLYIYENVSSKEELENIVVGFSTTEDSPAKQPVFLKDVASIEAESNPSRISRYNGEYDISILANVSRGYSSADVTRQLIEQLDESKYPEVNWTYEGELSDIMSNFGDLGIQAVFAGFLVFLILLIQFNSFRQTFIILLSIPLAASGALFGLYFSGFPMSFTALMGMVSLMGIVVNNAILLVDSINKRMKEWMYMEDATISGTTRRIRPILLTTVTTILGLIPLIAANDELFSPMAIAIGSGLLFSTLITLLIIPIMYNLFHRTLKKSHR